MRLSVLNAMVWRLIAEVLRRHSPQHHFAVFESHPGMSARGCLHLALHHDGRPPDGYAQVIFNLGGPTGTMDLVQTTTGPERSIPFAEWMLERDPLEVVDAISRGLGLKVPALIGSSSAPTIAARVLAASLVRESLARQPLRITSGWVDTSGGSSSPAWTAWMPSADETHPNNRRAFDQWSPGMRRGSQIVALHEAPADETPLMDIGLAPIAIIDLTQAKVVLGSAKQVAAHIDLPAEFAANGRRIGPLADRLLGHLGR
jgi:hypothetical protein